MKGLTNTAGLGVRQAARLAGVPPWKVYRLINEEVIFSPRTSGIRRVSESVVQELPRLCKQHFTPSGEFIHNPATIVDFHTSEVGGVKLEHYRSIT